MRIEHSVLSGQPLGLIVCCCAVQAVQCRSAYLRRGKSGEQDALSGIGMHG